MTKSEQIIELTNHYGAQNYVPLPIVVAEAEGIWVTPIQKVINIWICFQLIQLLTKDTVILKLFKHLKDQADKVTFGFSCFS